MSWALEETNVADNAKNTTTTVIPTLRYQDAPVAIEWLCEAFGFEKHLVVPGESGTIAHAQLVFGNGMIMLGSALDREFDKLQKPPNALGNVPSQSPHHDVRALRGDIPESAGGVLGLVELTVECRAQYDNAVPEHQLRSTTAATLAGDL